jgi:hypothetical protein
MERLAQIEKDKGHLMEQLKAATEEKANLNALQHEAKIKQLQEEVANNTKMAEEKQLLLQKITAMEAELQQQVEKWGISRQDEAAKLLAEQARKGCELSSAVQFKTNTIGKKFAPKVCSAKLQVINSVR